MLNIVKNIAHEEYLRFHHRKFRENSPTKKQILNRKASFTSATPQNVRIWSRSEELERFDFKLQCYFETETEFVQQPPMSR